MPPHSREDLELWELPAMRWKDMLNIKTRIVKSEICRDINQLQELDTGPQEYELLLLLSRDLRSLSWLQRQADNKDSEFEGAIHLVQKVIEVGYGSQLGPATSRHDEKSSVPEIMEFSPREYSDTLSVNKETEEEVETDNDKNTSEYVNCNFDFCSSAGF